MHYVAADIKNAAVQRPRTRGEYMPLPISITIMAHMTLRVSRHDAAVFPEYGNQFVILQLADGGVHALLLIRPIICPHADRHTTVG